MAAKSPTQLSPNTRISVVRWRAQGFKPWAIAEHHGLPVDVVKAICAAAALETGQQVRAAKLRRWRAESATRIRQLAMEAK